MKENLFSRSKSAHAGKDARAPGWKSRGYLPHFDGGEIPQMITFRLADSLPQEVLANWKRQLHGKGATRSADTALRRRIETYLDMGYGYAYLKEHHMASLIQDSLLYLDGERYRLLAWVIMPNHVHSLLTPFSGQPLSSILHSLKSYTAQQANKYLRRRGRFWQEDYFDRFIRNDKHLAKAITYIENNPVKAGLCRDARDWPFGSASFR
ncbi:MAG TPA: transposase [Pyrinomonadaceae bacterium]|nr:transposase [Pyrinomonadaceae bacterium]